MITSILKTALTTAGCTSVLYESDKLAGVITDQPNQADIIGLILQPNTMTFEVKGNGVHHHYPPVVIEIMKQVKMEDIAENNETTLTDLTLICDKFILALIKTGSFKKITSFTASKIPENKYDANILGWSLPLDLFAIENTQNC
jgi:hypothetical protein